MEPPSSSQAIWAVRYELRPSLIAMVHENPFSGEGDENPYTHLRDFDQLCSCIHIQGMRRVTLKWKLFPFSLTGKATRWYSRYVGSVDGEWEKLQAKLCLTYFPISRVAQARREGISRCSLGANHRLSNLRPKLSHNRANANAAFLSRS